MRTLFVVALLSLLAACRFDQPIPASLDFQATDLVGDWKAESGNERVIISDLKAGRLRLLYRAGDTGAVLDGHVIELDGQRYLQTQILVVLKEKSTTKAPQKRWMIWKVELKDKEATLYPVIAFSLDGENEQAMIASAKKSLANKENLGPPSRWKWIGSDKPAKL